MHDPFQERGVPPFERRVAEHGLGLRARVEVGAVGVRLVDVHDERQLLDERAVAQLGRAEELLRRLLLADVADARREQRPVRQLDPVDRQLRVELAPVGTLRGDQHRVPEHLRLARLQMSPEADLVRVAQPRRDEQLRHAPPDCLRAGVAEGRLRRAVEVDDASFVVHGHDRVERRVEHGAVPRLCGQECLLRVRPVGEWVPHGFHELRPMHRHSRTLA